MRKELQTLKESESMLRGEIEVSSEFDPPPGAIVVRSPDSLDNETVQRLLDGLADLVTAVSREELAAALGVEMGEYSYAPGDTMKTLVGRARRSLS